MGGAAAILLSTAAAARCNAQAIPEFRADLIQSRTTAIHAGAGILFPVGTYVRSGIVVGAGYADGGLSARADIVSSFHLDPFRESKWGPYGGGGISFRRDWRPSTSNSYLLVYVGAEGPPRNGYSPAIELGLGGGFRAGVILRRARGSTR